MKNHNLPNKVGAYTHPNIQYDPELMEAVVTRVLSTDRLTGAEQKEFRAESDAIYSIPRADERLARFQELYSRWFRRLRFDALIAAAFTELPEVQRATTRVTVTGAASHTEERADLAVDSGSPISRGDGGFWIGIRVQPARFLDEVFGRWLRHELWHVRDMLDPAFAYRRGDDAAIEAVDRLPQRVVQERYALVWSFSIDARVERSGLEACYSVSERRARLARAFPAFPAELHAAILASLGVTFGRSHPEILELARQPRKFAEVLNYPLAELNGLPHRGSPCPLCHFPTFQWADLDKPGIQTVLSAIRDLYPNWKRTDGICGTCFDRFAIRADVWI